MAVPETPTDLSATAVSDTRIDLSWTEDISAGYYIDQSPDNQTWTRIADIPPPVTWTSVESIKNAVITSIDLTFTVTSENNNAIFAFPGSYAKVNGQIVSSVVLDPGGVDEQSFTFETRASNNYQNNRTIQQEIWYLVSPPVGTFTIRATFDQEVEVAGFAVVQHGNVNQSDPIGSTNTASGTGSKVSSTVTTTTTDALVVGASVLHAAATHTPGTDDNERWDFSEGSGQDLGAFWGADTEALSAGSYTVSATASTSAEWCALSAEIKNAETDTTGPFTYTESSLFDIQQGYSPNGGLIISDSLTAQKQQGVTDTAGANMIDSIILAKQQSESTSESSILGAAISLAKSLEEDKATVLVVGESVSALIQKDITQSFDQEISLSLSLDKTLTTQNTKDLQAISALVLPKQNDITASIGTNAVDSFVNMAKDLSIDATGGPLFVEALTLTHSYQIDIESISFVIAEGGVSLGKSLIQEQSGAVDVAEDIVLVYNLSESDTTDISAIDDLSFDKIQDLSPATEQIIEDSVTFNKIIDVLSVGGPLIAEEISIGKVHGISVENVNKIIAQISTGKSLGIDIETTLQAGGTLLIDSARNITLSSTGQVSDTVSLGKVLAITQVSGKGGGATILFSPVGERTIIGSIIIKGAK